MYMWFLSFSFLVNLQEEEETEKKVVWWLAFFFYDRHMTILGVIVMCLLKKKNLCYIYIFYEDTNHLFVKQKQKKVFHIVIKGWHV